MSRYNNEGIANLAYYDSDTLEVDRGFSRGFPHSNPYDAGPDSWNRAGAAVGSGGGWGPTEMLPAYSATAASALAPRNVVSRGGWRESWRDQTSVEMSPVHPPPPLPSSQTPRWQPRQSYSISMHTMRYRGARKMSMFGTISLDQLGLSEEDVQDEMDNEEQYLVKSLIAMSTKDSDVAIRRLPMSFNEKKRIRQQVLESQSFKRKHHFSWFANCSGQISMFVRRLKAGSASTKHKLALWQGYMKQVGGKFGSGVLSYFLFLKWLLMFNVFSFLVSFGFLAIPQLVHGDAFSSKVKFTGLELLTGTGYFDTTILYYSGYSGATVGTPPGATYNIRLAYLLTISAYMVLCGVSLIYSMAASFRSHFVLQGMSSGAWTVLCSWDFRVLNEEDIRQRKANLTIQLKESLSEKAQKDQLSSSETLKRYGVHLGIWLLCTGLAVGACAGIYFLADHEYKTLSTQDSDAQAQASTLLVPFVVSLVNLVIPLIYSFFNKFEQFSNPRFQVYTVIMRNVFLKLSILGILCYYWMHIVARDVNPYQCWELFVGQSLYRLVVFDFFFLLLGSLFGELLSKVIGTTCVLSLGVPEFDIARNVLDLIFSQTLAWIAMYFSPLLTVIQIFKFFILFFVKKVSLMHNCQPPRRSGRAAQMQTIFIALLFFPAYIGALSVIAYTFWSLKPSLAYGPFKCDGQMCLNKPFDVVTLWMSQEVAWVVWIYEHVIRSELFFYLLSLFILVCTYFFWQVKEGRKLLIVRLRQRIVNEGTDKTFLIEKLHHLSKKLKKSSASKTKTKRNNQKNASSRQRNAELEYQTIPESHPPVPGTGMRAAAPGSGLRATVAGNSPPMPGSGPGATLPDSNPPMSGVGLRASVNRNGSPNSASGLRATLAGGDSSMSGSGFRASLYGNGPPMSALAAGDSPMFGGGMRATLPGGRPTALVMADSAPSAPSSLVQAMMARQQAELEEDDDDEYGY